MVSGNHVLKQYTRSFVPVIRAQRALFAFPCQEVGGVPLTVPTPYAAVCEGVAPLLKLSFAWAQPLDATVQVAEYNPPAPSVAAFSVPVLAPGLRHVTVRPVR